MYAKIRSPQPEHLASAGAGRPRDRPYVDRRGVSGISRSAPQPGQRIMSRMVASTGTFVCPRGDAYCWVAACLRAPTRADPYVVFAGLLVAIMRPATFPGSGATEAVAGSKIDSNLELVHPFVRPCPCLIGC